MLLLYLTGLAEFAGTIAVVVFAVVGGANEVDEADFINSVSLDIGAAGVGETVDFVDSTRSCDFEFDGILIFAACVGNVDDCLGLNGDKVRGARFFL